MRKFLSASLTLCVAVLYFAVATLIAQSTINVGIPVNFFTNTATTPATGTTYALPSITLSCTWQTIYTVAPASITVQLKTSNDNSSFSIVDTSTTVGGEIRTINTSARFIQARINASSGGSGATVTINCLPVGLGPAGAVGNTGNTGSTGVTGSTGATGSGGGTPGGPNTSVQFDNSGALGGSPNFTYDSSVGLLALGGTPTTLPAYIGTYGPTSGLTPGVMSATATFTTPSGATGDYGAFNAATYSHAVVVPSIVDPTYNVYLGQLSFGDIPDNSTQGIKELYGSMSIAQNQGSGDLGYLYGSLSQASMLTVGNTVVVGNDTEVLTVANPYSIQGNQVQVHVEDGTTFTNYITATGSFTFIDAMAFTTSAWWGHVAELTNAGHINTGTGFEVRISGGGSIGDSYSFYAHDLGGLTITNPYYSWFDSRGVRRVREDNTFDSVGQSIEALYNPLFAKYTPGAVDFERVILGQWNGNVAEIGTENGGTGTLRPLRLIGSGVQVGEAPYANTGDIRGGTDFSIWDAAGGGAGTVVFSQVSDTEQQFGNANIGAFYFGGSSAGTVNGAIFSAALVTGHYSNSTSTLSVANVGANSCGTSAATIVGGENTGIVTVGATAGTQCRIAFSASSSTRRQCTVSNESTAALVRAAYVDSTHSDLLGTFAAGAVLAYECSSY